LQTNLESPSFTQTEVLAQLANLPEDGNSKEVTGWKNDFRLGDVAQGLVVCYLFKILTGHQQQSTCCDSIFCEVADVSRGCFMQDEKAHFNNDIELTTFSRQDESY